MLLYSEESPDQAKNGLLLLMNSAWNEVGHGSLKLLKPNPNHETYYRLHNAKVLHILTARKNSEMVGYATLLITNLMQFKEIKGCFVDSLFLDKRYRTIGGYKFLKFIENYAKDSGANRMRWDVTVHNDFGRTLKRMDYALESFSYGKDL